MRAAVRCVLRNSSNMRWKIYRDLKVRVLLKRRAEGEPF